MSRFVSRVAAGGGILGAVAYLTDEKWRRTRAYGNFCDKVAVPAMRRLFDAETAHVWSIRAVEWGLSPLDPTPTAASLATRVWKTRFAHPIGCAAGYDKHAEAVDGLLGMGFAHVEVGGVTPRPQSGNPRPRSFRLVDDRAVINRYGLNSHGADEVGARLARGTRARGIVGANIAPNTSTAAEDRPSDYGELISKIGPHVDYIVVNVSCPNVSWTSKLGSSGIRDIVADVQRQARERFGDDSPAILLKVSPDMSQDARVEMAKLALDLAVDGMVVSNTSSRRADSLASPEAGERGGLSGAPIKEAALATLRDIYAATNGQIPLVGVGGISSGADAYERIRAGASLVQLYTALVYEGPGLVPRIKTELAELLSRDGFATVADAVGADVDVAGKPKAKRRW